jgi:hypothetical protein
MLPGGEVMAPDEIRQKITAVPFRPFTLHTADGRAIPVHARDFILVSPRGMTVDVYQPDDRHDILDTIQITGISFDPPASAPPAQQSQPTNP